MGKGCLRDDHPLLLGQTGFWGTPIANDKCRTADVILAVGTAQAIPFGLVGRALGIPLWFAESLTRVERPSRTGRWIYKWRLSEHFFYYWSSLAGYYPRGTYITVFA